MIGRKDWFSRERELPRSNAAEAILEDLVEGIRTEQIEVGTRFPSEFDLAGHYGVSRPIVREALRSLQTLGLTQTRTGSGTYVIATQPRSPQRFGDYTTRDLMEARAAIEVPSARLAARRRTEADAAELMNLCDRLDHESQSSAWVDLDSLLHARIAAASGNAVFSMIVADARKALSQQSEFINLVADRRQPSNIEHREIVEAIIARDSERAAAAMQAHLGYVEDVVRPMLEND
ncbi:FadR/GntR family transcriptional regulator [Gulosibacter sp. ACHW.36C]|uniref:FadR family transcriptional regulator n=1 Tax=Gulosibacter sediminis TaxID=1729695 RepID=A0ABY4MXP5_9MICO|nr:FadR/GntR family transcriptional regulator [Gulosibacter sediminis]UQN14156.1 FadR family transcriptional regulator [Gulosibacter sediminis]